MESIVVITYLLCGCVVSDTDVCGQEGICDLVIMRLLKLKSVRDAQVS